MPKMGVKGGAWCSGASHMPQERLLLTGNTVALYSKYTYIYMNSIYSIVSCRSKIPIHDIANQLSAFDY